MTFFSRAATFLALSAAAATVNAQDGILGGFQSGPSEGAFYASGMNYIPWKNRAFFTGLHYNEEIMPKELVQNSEMTGVSKDHASNCYLAKMDFDEESNNGFYKSMTDWMSYGNPKKIETCTAVAAKGDSDVFVVGSVEEGGIFSDGYPMQGLLSVLDKDTLEFLDATLIKSAEDPNMHMVYPLDVIHDYHRKFIYIAALTSKDAVENEITGNKWSPGNQGMPNWNEEQKLGSGFDVTVVKIHAPDGQKPTAKWVKHYPLDVEDDGTTPPVFIGGMAIQEGSNGVQHLLITGSTRGNGEAFGASAPGSVDEDGFVMQLQPSDGSLIKQERHKGDGKIVDDVREGTPKDDFIGGMCNNLGRGHETNTQGESDHFYIVGGTKGDMTSNRFGVQNADGAGLQINASFKDKYGKTLQRAAAWLYVFGVMPFFVLGSLCFLNRAHTLWGDTADIAGLVLFLLGGVPYSVGAWLDIKVLQWRQQCTDTISPIAAAIPILPAVGVVIWSVGCTLDFPGEEVAKTDLAAVMFIVGSIFFCISVGISNVLLCMDRYSRTRGAPHQLSWPTQHSETLSDVMRLSDDSAGSPQHVWSQCDGRESSDSQV